MHAVSFAFLVLHVRCQKAPEIALKKLSQLALVLEAGADIRAQMPKGTLQPGSIPEDVVADAAHAQAPGEMPHLRSASEVQGTAEQGATGEPGVVKDGQAEQGLVSREEQQTAAQPADSNAPREYPKINKTAYFFASVRRWCSHQVHDGFALHCLMFLQWRMEALLGLISHIRCCAQCSIHLRMWVQHG